MDRYTVLIVESHPVVSEGIKSILRSKEEYIVVGEVKDGQEAIVQTRAHKPDIVIMELTKTGLNSLAAAKKIKETSPDTHIIIYTMLLDPHLAIELFKLGISAYLLKNGPTTDLIKALEAIKNDATYFRSAAPRAVAGYLKKEIKASRDIDRLSRRELEIFRLLADGMSIKSIAQKLCIHRKTVETHKYHIMEKLEAHTLAEFTKIALRNNLISA